MPEVSPFDLVLSLQRATTFAVMGMHFKLGLYEHQSAGAIQGVMDLLAADPTLVDDPQQMELIRVSIYEPAFSIIGDPAKRDPRTRQSADHSMLYILGTLLRKAHEARGHGWDGQGGWQRLMLEPADYAEDDSALMHPLTRQLMEKIDFRHGGPEFDQRYPDGIPTTVVVAHAKLGQRSSHLVMYPEGHARCDSGNLGTLLEYKFRLLAALGVEDVIALVARFTNLAKKSPAEIAALYDFEILGLV